MAGAHRDKIRQIYDILPQLNCGFCGYENCGQFAKAVAGGRASPFGCQQNPWAGHRISEIMGMTAPFFGYHHRFYQPSFMSRPGISPSLESLGKEVSELSERMGSILDRIENLRMKLKRGENR